MSCNWTTKEQEFNISSYNNKSKDTAIQYQNGYVNLFSTSATKKSINKEIITHIDTVSILVLINSQYGNSQYSIQKLNYYQTGAKSIEILLEDRQVAYLSLPRLGDVKNFSVNNILETHSGFKVKANWGGGNYFYSRDFFFDFTEGRFYLTKVVNRFYNHSEDKEIETIVDVIPARIIDTNTIMDHIRNE
jgi:hypothetical protein